MSKPKITVIIPAYNASATIHKSLASAVRQTYPHFEIIVVDDGSTQEFLSVIEEFDGKFLYHRQDNKGAAGARNTGAHLATGEYLAFLDSDDSWHPQKLELQMQVLHQGHNFDICYCDSRLDRSYHERPMQLDVSKIQKMTTDEIYSSPFFGLPNVIIKKATFEEVGGFDESLVTAEDIDLYLRNDLANKLIIHLEQPLMFRHFREGSLSNQSRSYVDFDEVILRNGAKSRVSPAVLAAAVRDNRIKMTQFCLWNGDYAGFKIAIAKLLDCGAYLPALMYILKSPFSAVKRALK